MTPILKVDPKERDDDKELAFEIAFQRSLTTAQRFEMMLARSRELAEQLQRGMDTEGLLRSLNARSVRYVVIGAAAFPVHGYARATLDIDIFIDPTPRNALATRQALSDFGYDLSDVTVEELLTKKVLIRQYVLETDIHPFVAGVGFDEVWRGRIEDKLGETPASFAGLDDLIRMKRAAGRPKDIEDLRVLLQLKDQRA